MKWLFLFGNLGFAAALVTLAAINRSTAGLTILVAVVSLFTAYVVWADCREEWKP